MTDFSKDPVVVLDGCILSGCIMTVIFAEGWPVKMAILGLGLGWLFRACVYHLKRPYSYEVVPEHIAKGWGLCSCGEIAYYSKGKCCKCAVKDLEEYRNELHKAGDVHPIPDSRPSPDKSPG